MARAEMALRRGTNHGNAECDDVQRSIELLDRVLSEFDDVENANQVQNIQVITSSVSTPQLLQRQSSSVSSPCANVSTTPDDESPSLGHQSEDDGYMSMNGRKAKFNLTFKPVTEVVNMSVPEGGGGVGSGGPVGVILRPDDSFDLPPPPEEAQKLIATLLPKVSPSHSTKKSYKPRCSPITQLNQQFYCVEAIPPPQNFQNHFVPNGLVDNHTATQTTLPKTRHQRPYGWETNETPNNPTIHPMPPPGYRFGSLPYQHGVYSLTSPTKVPPRTVATAVERHREVKRHGGSDDNMTSDAEVESTDARAPRIRERPDDEHFSDDSLEEILPPPPVVVNKRASVAWEVPLDDQEIYAPGSTKVIGRRRRKSGSQSSTSSIPSKLKDFDDWPDPPPCTTEDEVASSLSDADEILLPSELNAASLSGTGTYIIRRGKRRSGSEAASKPGTGPGPVRFASSRDSASSSELGLSTPGSRHSVDLTIPSSRLSQDLNSPKCRYSLDLNNDRNKKHSTTYDNIKALIQEGVIEHYNGPQIESTTDLNAMVNPIVRVVSLPSLSAEEMGSRRELSVTVEEEEDDSLTSSSSDNISPLRKIEQNISELLERRDIEVSSLIQNDKCILKVNGIDEKKIHPTSPREIKKSSSQHDIERSEEYYRQKLIDGGNVGKPRRGGIQKSESAKEMLISHREKEIKHIAMSSSADFPIKVEVIQHDFPPLPPSPVEEDDEYSDILQNMKTRADTLPNSSDPPAVPPHTSSSNSLKTRSMDANYNRGRRNYAYTSNRSITPERRVSTDTEKRKLFQKRTLHSPQEEHHMQTSCSLPETPIFARGCDIPRTPHRRAPEIPGVPGISQTTPRQSSTMSSINTIGNMSTGGYKRNLSTSGMEQAYMGAELLRMAGGPGRGWYPKQRQRRPASIEHLDRLAPGQNPWDGQRKPQTLPPNLTPKFFQRSPRDALRRVTSLLVKKGNSPKESRKDKEMVSPTIHENPTGEETHKKKGFFKSLWKRSRHYSLEQ